MKAHGRSVLSVTLLCSQVSEYHRFEGTSACELKCNAVGYTTRLRFPLVTRMFVLGLLCYPMSVESVWWIDLAPICL